VNWMASLLPALRQFLVVWHFLVGVVFLLTGAAAIALWFARRVLD
jgi:hypothetical protein